MDKRKQRRYHARDRTKKYQKKRKERRYANDVKDRRFTASRREKRGSADIPKDVSENKKRRLMKRRISNGFSAKLRCDAEIKPIQRARETADTTDARTDETSQAIASESVLAVRRNIYRSKRIGEVFREKTYEKAAWRDAKKPEPTVEREAKHERNRKIQKSRQKRDYVKNYRNSKKGLPVSSGNAGSDIFRAPRKAKAEVAEMAAKFFRSGNKYGIILTIVLTFLVLTVTMVFLGAFISGIASIVASTTYPSSDEDISDTDTAYAAIETALNNQINAMESTHPRYDEYRYQVDEISHNPYELISYLTVKYGEFTYEDVKDELKDIFNRQYTLRVWEEIEIRTRTVEKTGTRTVTDPDTGEETTEEYTYEVEEEYEYRILNISLTNKGIRSIAAADFTPEKLSLFDTYTSLHGNRNGLFDESMIPAEVDRYEIPPEALSDERFRRMITEAEKYLGYPYVWGGSSPSTSFDCSGFVSYVINNCGNGWNVGRSTAEGLRQTTSYVSATDARPGDLIFFQGTYNTSGASHVGIYVGDGMMIHCGNPIQYSSINTPYWQNHFYQFGRLP